MRLPTVAAPGLLSPAVAGAVTPRQPLHALLGSSAVTVAAGSSPPATGGACGHSLSVHKLRGAAADAGAVTATGAAAPLPSPPSRRGVQALNGMAGDRDGWPFGGADDAADGAVVGGDEDGGGEAQDSGGGGGGGGGGGSPDAAASRAAEAAIAAACSSLFGGAPAAEPFVEDSYRDVLRGATALAPAASAPAAGGRKAARRAGSTLVESAALSDATAEWTVASRLTDVPAAAAAADVDGGGGARAAKRRRGTTASAPPPPQAQPPGGGADGLARFILPAASAYEPDGADGGASRRQLTGCTVAALPTGVPPLGSGAASSAEASPPGAGTAGPTPRWGHVVAPVPSGGGGSLLLFAGEDDAAVRGDVWLGQLHPAPAASVGAPRSIAWRSPPNVSSSPRKWASAVTVHDSKVRRRGARRMLPTHSSAHTHPSPVTRFPA
jgi:hypothetical protein